MSVPFTNAERYADLKNVTASTDRLPQRVSHELVEECTRWLRQTGGDKFGAFPWVWNHTLPPFRAELQQSFPSNWSGVVATLHGSLPRWDVRPVVTKIWLIAARGERMGSGEKDQPLTSSPIEEVLRREFVTGDATAVNWVVDLLIRGARARPGQRAQFEVIMGCAQEAYQGALLDPAKRWRDILGHFLAMLRWRRQR